MNTSEQLVIIGSGPAALTAAIYSARARLNPLVIEGPQPGGQLMGTTLVENWPGDKEILGPVLMQRMRDHAISFGARFLGHTVTAIEGTESPFILITAKKQITTCALIIATGATPRRLGIPGEQEYWAKGVSTCAVCDGVFYAGKRVVIIGGGDTAMEDASFMVKIAKSVTIIQNLATLTASKPMQERVLKNPAITIYYNAQVTEIFGNGTTVTGISIIVNGQAAQTIETDGVMLAIGLKPNTTFLPKALTLRPSGHINLTQNTETTIPGIFAAGDVCDARYRQAITSAGSGCMAALDAERYLAQFEHQ